MPHESPNGAQPGSFIYEAEEWFVSIGMAIPEEATLPCTFHGMLDDYVDRGPFMAEQWEAADR